MKVVVLSGGVGGARLCAGLTDALPESALSIIVNTGDDFDHLGFRICPDLDTVIYTLAGLANPDTGWGRADESWNVLQELGKLGGPTWFRLGDKDLALHIERKRLLDEGLPLSQVIERLKHNLGVQATILPMSDDRVATIVISEGRHYPFQEYFVAKGCEPVVEGFHFEGADDARPAPGVMRYLSNAHFVVLGPSNPWVSLDPILSIPGIREALQDKVVVGVSPLIGGKALKGPAAKMFRELGLTPSAAAVAGHYQDILNGFVIDEKDAVLEDEVARLGLEVRLADTIMTGPESRLSLAKEVLDLGIGIMERAK